MVERWQHTQVIRRADVCVNGNSTVSILTAGSCEVVTQKESYVV